MYSVLSALGVHILFRALAFLAGVPFCHCGCQPPVASGFIAWPSHGSGAVSDLTHNVFDVAW